MFVIGWSACSGRSGNVGHHQGKAPLTNIMNRSLGKCISCSQENYTMVKVDYKYMYIRMTESAEDVSFGHDCVFTALVKDFYFGHYFHCVVLWIYFTCHSPYFAESAFANDVTKSKRVYVY